MNIQKVCNLVTLSHFGTEKAHLPARNEERWPYVLDLSSLGSREAGSADLRSTGPRFFTGKMPVLPKPGSANLSPSGPRFFTGKMPVFPKPGSANPRSSGSRFFSGKMPVHPKQIRRPQKRRSALPCLKSAQRVAWTCGLQVPVLHWPSLPTYSLAPSRRHTRPGTPS